ncbi:MAG: KH domain-containing protein [Bacilli bacterium]|nr:KH domain-containing protein [Bacilli bacterium]
MTNPNYEEFVANLVKPLVAFPDEVKVATLTDEGDEVTLEVMVNTEDLGRVIGKKGRIANSIRTIAFAFGARHNRRIDIVFDAFNE